MGGCSADGLQDGAAPCLTGVVTRGDSGGDGGYSSHGSRQGGGHTSGCLDEELDRCLLGPVNRAVLPPTCVREAGRHASSGASAGSPRTNGAGGAGHGKHRSKRGGAGGGASSSHMTRAGARGNAGGGAAVVARGAALAATTTKHWWQRQETAKWSRFSIGMCIWDMDMWAAL